MATGADKPTNGMTLTNRFMQVTAMVGGATILAGGGSLISQRVEISGLRELVVAIRED